VPELGEEGGREGEKRGGGGGEAGDREWGSEGMEAEGGDENRDEGEDKGGGSDEEEEGMYNIAFMKGKTCTN
jgi:hypothetical protein